MSTAPKSNLLAGIGGALVGALVGAGLWAVLVSVTDYKIGYAAIGIGALTGFLAGRLGGSHPALPFAAAGIALLGCMIGDLLILGQWVVEGFKADGVQTSVAEVLKEMAKDPGGFGKAVYQDGFSPMNLVFYALAAFAGFSLATKQGLAVSQPDSQNWPGPAPTPTGDAAPSGAPVFPPVTPEPVRPEPVTPEPVKD